MQAWAGQKSFRAKKKGAKHETLRDDPGNPTVDFHGEKRSNETHVSTTDPEARLYKKSAGSEAKLSYLGPVLAENRNGLVVETRVTKATGKAEREAAREMIRARTGGWCGRCCFDRCTGPAEVHSAVAIPGAFASSLPWCRAR
jgi:hypothetical protein